MIQTMQASVTRKKRRSRRKHGPTFEFVIDTGISKPMKDLQHGDARTIIRRQAARSGRQTRRRGTRGQEPGPCAGISFSDAGTPPGSDNNAQEGINLSLWARQPAPVTQPSYNGYETIRVIYNFDVTALDSFTNVDLATNAYRLLQGDVGNPVAFLQNGSSSSFLAYLPSRYGTMPFLDDAIHCVAARAAQMLGYSTVSSSPSALYSKALRSLRHHIQSSPSSSVSDIYCATRLFVLYEVEFT